MALGLPVISTNVGGINDLIQDKQNGLLVDKADIMAMVEEIKCLINGEIDAQLISINARELVEKFDSSKMRRKIFGEIEKYGVTWRAGANAQTVIHLIEVALI